MSLTIRPLTSADYPAVAELQGQIFDKVVTVESMKWEDENRDPRCKWGRWVAEWDGAIVGAASYGQSPATYHPHRFGAMVIVLPEFRGRGIGTALYQQVMEGLAPHNPQALNTMARSCWPEGIAFAAKHGFIERMRTWESHLDLNQFDATSFVGVAEAALTQGYQIKSYADLAEDPERNQKLYDLVMEVRRDVPSTEPWTDTPYEQWFARLQQPHFFPEGYLIGIKDGEWVGLSALWKTDEPDKLSTGLTGIKGAHRGTGLAKALKVRAVGIGQAHGYRQIKTFNESNNQRMLAINDWLGFQKQPAWISLVKELKD